MNDPKTFDWACTDDFGNDGWYNSWPPPRPEQEEIEDDEIDEPENEDQ